MQLSIIICAHNPRPDYLGRVLGALREQTLPKERWELLLIDNASKEPLAAIWNLGWHPSARHVRENELGLTPARLRGIREACAEVLIFVDDDNVLEAGYLEHANRLSAEWPKLGAWGGTCEPEFEKAPAPELARITECLAIRSVNRAMWCNFAVGNYQAIPFGAGMCVRRAVAEEYLRLAQKDPCRFSLDRKGTSLVSGGDLDLALTAHDLGLGTGLFPELILTHLIPARRVQKEYLVKMFESQAYSEYRLRNLREPAVQSEFSMLSEIKHLCKLCFMKPTDRTFASAYRRGRRQAEAELFAGPARLDLR